MKAHSFARRRNRYYAFVAVDRHCGVQRSGTAAKILQKLPRARTLHGARLEQLRVIGSGVSLRLPLADDRQHFDLFHGLRPERKSSKVTVVQARTVMSSQDVARGVEDDLATIDFDALRMGRVMSEDDIGACIDQVVGNARFSGLTSAEREVAQWMATRT